MKSIMKDALRNLVLKLVGCPYIWGGQNPWTGFDCSGFVVWVFQVFGILPAGDWTAQSLHEHFFVSGEVLGAVTGVGDLIFYGSDRQHITHVMMGIGGNLVIGASGGGHLTTTLLEARRIGAQVKVKPGNYRSDMVSHLPTGPLFDGIEMTKVNP
jgi:cell wall-associated NlpC family hydrolase